MCFSPLTGNLLIADSDNFSVQVQSSCLLLQAPAHMLLSSPQEVTVTGDHVRTIGDGVVNDGIVGVSANIDLIAVSSHCLLGNIWLFSITTGALIRSFGVSGHAEGQLSISTGIRLTSDGHHIYIAESGNDRVSLFTILGDFVRCFGKGVLDCPLDVDIATNGDVVVADTRNDLIRVFSADGSTLVRSFGRNSGGTREFKSPTALAIHRGALVVLCRGSPNILYLK